MFDNSITVHVFFKRQYFIPIGLLQVSSTFAKVDRILEEAGSNRNRILVAHLWFEKTLYPLLIRQKVVFL